MKRTIRPIIAVALILAALAVFAACDGANSSAWTMVVNESEQTLGGGFSHSVGSARSGHRNRTFTLAAAELASIRIDSTSEEGSITLTISQDGVMDGSEIILDVSNFSGFVVASGLDPGRIRFQLRHENTRNTNTTITWR